MVTNDVVTLLPKHLSWMGVVGRLCPRHPLGSSVTGKRDGDVMATVTTNVMAKKSEDACALCVV